MLLLSLLVGSCRSVLMILNLSPGMSSISSAMLAGGLLLALTASLTEPGRPVVGMLIMPYMIAT